MNSISDAPDSLFDLAMAVFVSDTEAAIKYELAGGFVATQANADLPVEVLQRFLAAYQRKYCVDDDTVRHLCKSRTRLRSIKLKNAKITDHGLALLLGLKPRDLELVDCTNLTPASLHHIQDKCASLIGIKIIESKAPRWPSSTFTLDAPALQWLIMRLPIFDGIQPFKVRALDKLVHLDLSGCSIPDGLSETLLECLDTLILHAVPKVSSLIGWLVTLPRLRVLDISQISEVGKFDNPNELLNNIVCSLPRLTHLDISGTNLAGSGGMMPANVEAAQCDIPGLASRVNRPLQFLGLYETYNSACKRHDIPALSIAGDANEKQVLTAAEAYMERPHILSGVLNQLYYLYRNEEASQVDRALATVLQAMDRHLADKVVQISGSAALFYIINNRQLQQMNATIKRRVISVLLLGMNRHIEDEILMKNGCLTLTRFSIPSDVLFQYQTMARILLTGVLNQRFNDFLRRMGIYLLNSLACQVDTVHKQILGRMGAIEKILEIIRERVETNTGDTMLEMGWSTLWNMTDELQENCERFLRCNGLNLFLACLRSFPNKDDQLRNMMGLLGNVAENPPLRGQLRSSKLLKVFYELLNSSSHGIEVSYNAGGVLAHIASDGAGAWDTSEPPRNVVMERLSSSVDGWDLNAECNINYRSFRPILGLLYATHTPQCQHWAAWALANLTTVYPDKYCKLVVAENGMELLEQVIAQDTTSERVRHLCSKVVVNVKRHLSLG